MTIKQKKSRKEDTSYDSERSPGKRRKRGSFEIFENWKTSDLPTTRTLPDFTDKVK